MIRSPGLRAAFAALVVSVVVVPSAAAAKSETLVVCKHGCKYSKIQKAVDAARQDDTVQVKPGTYKESVQVGGQSHDGLTIEGTKKNAKKVVLNGKGKFNNGIEVANSDGVRILNLTFRNYAANGVFAHECSGYLMKNLRAEFNRGYGLFAFNCRGGRMTRSIGFGQGDSAYYIGATPVQKKPKQTELDHLKAYENVLGYSGTNSKYVHIHDSEFFNNGAGIVPNTLDSEPFEPNSNGVIEDNNIFWNNFNYYLPDSPVQTTSGGLGEFQGQTINYPTGVGVVLLGSSDWVVRDNQIFGNFKWGSIAISDAVGNEGDDAISRNNQFLDNLNGRGGTDTNAVDFFVDGSGSGNCFSGNVSSTFDPSDSATTESLYPACPAPPPPASGTGGSAGDSDQFIQLASYVLADPPSKQECSWTKHEHPPFKNYQPLAVPGAQCP